MYTYSSQIFWFQDPFILLKIKNVKEVYVGNISRYYALKKYMHHIRNKDEIVKYIFMSFIQNNKVNKC